jgi:murein DD-endopeptidase MepM/ murein hydrolase activator NlpD
MRRGRFDLYTIGGLVRTGLAAGALLCALFIAVRLGRFLLPGGPGIPEVTEAPAAPPPAELVDRALQFPVVGISPASIVDSFDDPRSGGLRTHHAIDIMAPRGTPVVAVDDGVVVKLHRSVAGGITV